MAEPDELTDEQQQVLDELAAAIQAAVAPFVGSVSSVHAAIMLRPVELITVKIVLPAGDPRVPGMDAAAAEANRAWERR